MAMLRRVMLKGFKSIKEMNIELRPLNIMIGANGAGKSNLISFFTMLNKMMDFGLELHVTLAGGVDSLLHYGRAVTQQVEGHLVFDLSSKSDEECSYHFRLMPGPHVDMVFAEETLCSTQSEDTGNSEVVSLGEGHGESRIPVKANHRDRTATIFRQLLSRSRVYHFHKGAADASARYEHDIADNLSIAPDAGNLAAFLYRLRNQDQSTAYRRIISTIRLVAPFFEDFDLVPGVPYKDKILLNWRDKESDKILGPHQLSDGTLRAISLITLLLQPEEELPDLIIVDEPELGLHPYALNLVAALFKKASPCASSHQHSVELVSRPF
jgi:predicted ATPase